MQPLLKSSRPRPKAIRHYWFQIVVLAFFAAVIGLLYFLGPGAILVALVLQAPFVGLIIYWVRRLRRTKGALPLLSGEHQDDATRLRLAVPARSRLQFSKSPREARVAPGTWLRVVEQVPDDNMEAITGLSPYRYTFVGTQPELALHSDARLVAADFAELGAFLAERDVRLETLLSLEQGATPRRVGPVQPGAPSAVTLAMPGRGVNLGVYGDRVAPGWIPAEYAYGYGFHVNWGTHLPVTITLAVDTLDTATWQSGASRALPAAADTVAFLSDDGVTELIAAVPQGFTAVYSFVRDTERGREVYIHCAGPPVVPA